MINFPIYPRPANAEARPLQLPVARHVQHGDPSGYLPDQGLVDAVNAALLLGQPLLVTGEPGTGKTELAYHLAWNLGLGIPLVFEAKTTSTARDLFYTIDTVGRFRAGSDNNDVRSFLTYQALGKAILLANPERSVKHLVTPTFCHLGPHRSVVLIDEIDKAPRDFPNDILNEIEYMRFNVPEISPDPVGAPEELRPIVVLTSNSEKHLPDPFLRRCIYYDIAFPTLERLKEIVLVRVSPAPSAHGGLLSEALEFFLSLRTDQTGMQKPPATAELLGWLDYVGKRLGQSRASLHDHPEILLASICCLAKGGEDQKVAVEFAKVWLGNRKRV